jgi:COMPASS component BRE2
VTTSRQVRDRSKKRKHADHQPAPVVYNDSTVVAQLPSLVPTAFEGPSKQRFCVTKNNPMNKAGFRYLACGPAPDLSLLYPLYRVVQSPPVDTVHFSWEDRSPYTYISQDGMAVMTDKGFRSARGTVPIREGTWYFEILVEKGGGDTPAAGTSGAHVRLGIGRRESSVNAPVGIDAYSYGIRDKTGEAMHLAQPSSYGESFTTGDVIGVLVHLPLRAPIQHVASPTLDPNIDLAEPSLLTRKRVPIRYKGQLYFELLEYAPAKEMTDLADAISDTMLVQPVKQTRQKAAAPGQKWRPVEIAASARTLHRLPGSAVYFFKNGQPMGSADPASGTRSPAFADLFDWLPLRQHPPKAETRKRRSPAEAALAARENHNDDGTIGYFPFVSVYGGGIARLNPGPTWHHAPTSSPNVDAVGSPSSWRPLCDRLPEYMAEERMYDEIEEAAAAPAKERAIAAAAKFMEQEAARVERDKERVAKLLKTSGGGTASRGSTSRASSVQTAAVERLSGRGSDRSRSATPAVVGAGGSVTPVEAAVVETPEPQQMEVDGQ